MVDVKPPLRFTAFSGCKVFISKARATVLLLLNVPNRTGTFIPLSFLVPAIVRNNTSAEERGHDSHCLQSRVQKKRKIIYSAWPAARQVAAKAIVMLQSACHGNKKMIVYVRFQVNIQPCNTATFVYHIIRIPARRRLSSGLCS